MFIDASAIVAILLREPGADFIKAAIDEASRKRLTSPMALFEAVMALARAKAPQGRKPTAGEILAAQSVIEAFVSANAISIVPITEKIGQGAVEAAARFGKAVGHPAGLNSGDCFAYACAKNHRTPLLFKGEDFSKTDVNQRP